MDVFEARQWELPVVFVCGLLEREFPQYHREDPILGDAARRRLGTEQRPPNSQAEERFLFELAVTRATEETVLSYSRFNEKGDETLPSFFLNGDRSPALRDPCSPRAHALRRAPGAPADSGCGPAAPARPDAPEAVAHRASKASCNARFNSSRARRCGLKERPPAPRDRLDMLVKGSILHRALAEWIAAPLFGSEVFDRVFEDECARKRIPATYRTEAVRLVLLRHFEGFLDEFSNDARLAHQDRERLSVSLEPGR